MNRNLQMIVESCVNKAFRTVIKEESELGGAYDVFKILNKNYLAHLNDEDKQHTELLDVEDDVVRLHNGMRIEFEQVGPNDMSFRILDQEDEIVPVDDEELENKIKDELLDLVSGEYEGEESDFPAGQEDEDIDNMADDYEDGHVFSDRLDEVKKQFFEVFDKIDGKKYF